MQETKLPAGSPLPRDRSRSGTLGLSRRTPHPAVRAPRQYARPANCARVAAVRRRQRRADLPMHRVRRDLSRGRHPPGLELHQRPHRRVRALKLGRRLQPVLPDHRRAGHLTNPTGTTGRPSAARGPSDARPGSRASPPHPTPLPERPPGASPRRTSHPPSSRRSRPEPRPRRTGPDRTGPNPTPPCRVLVKMLSA
jgi:hypothetical protein